MSNLLSAKETFALLERLRSIAREFAAREETLSRQQRNTLAALEGKFESERAALEQSIARESAELKSRHDQARDSAQAAFARRERKLAEAHASTKRRALDYLQQTEDRRKYTVQKGTLDAERGRDAALAANEAALADFHARLAANRERLNSIELQTFAAFRGYRRFRKPLAREFVASADETALSHSELLAELERIEADAAADLATFKRRVLPRFFRFAPLWCWFVLALICAFVLAPVLEKAGAGGFTPRQGYAAAGAGFALILGLFLLGQRSGPLALKLADALSKARALHNLALAAAQTWHDREIERLNQEAKDRARALRDEWETAVNEAAEGRSSWPNHIEDKWRRVRARNDALLRTRVARIEQERGETTEQSRRKAEVRLKELDGQQKALLADFKAKNDRDWDDLASEWRAATDPVMGALSKGATAAREEFPDWSAPSWRHWTAPNTFINFAPFARLELEIEQFAGSAPKDSRLGFEASRIEAALLLAFPEEGSLVIEADSNARPAALAALNSILFRVLTSSPPGKVMFTLFDPIGLGESFAGMARLGDFESNLLNGRIWTQPDQIDARLADLNEHIEKVVQMYLRNEYENIAEYNLAAGNIAEKYHFIVLADFPANLTETAARRLLRIVSIGARCGVFCLMHWNPRQGAIPEFLLEELRAKCLWIKPAGSGFALAHPSATPARLLLEAPPPPETGNALLEKIGDLSRGANRVEVPFGQVAPAPDETWSLNTAEELRIPIGRSGPAKLQYLAIGRGTRQHALIAGKTGSGKSTLFHVIITNGALWCSPDELEFYLIDFKKGVEFKPYSTRHLPHARVVAIESDREFAVSVLQRVADELSRRGDLFRKAGVQDIAAYRKASGSALPRTLLLIDEFQEFFVEEDRLAQSASLLLDRIVRQGRAFGIHVILGSQTLGGVYTLARSTIGQMVIRIALQSNEADAYLIMDENNSAPRLLSRPGEGIYNDMAGAVEANSPFQAVWISEQERDARLRQIRERADHGSKVWPPPVTFEGNAPADLRENATLIQALAHPAAEAPETARFWLGAPNSIKEPTEALLRKRSGSNLLIVSQSEESLRALVTAGLLSLDAQFPPETARFVLLDGSAPGSREREYLDAVLRAMRNPVERVNENLGGALHDLGDELNRRAEQNRAGPRIFLIICPLQNFKKLRPEDEFTFSIEKPEGPNPSADFVRVYTDGPGHGIHVIAAVDTYNNVNRFLGRKGLTEFEMRVLFQMSANDSASLADDPRANQLGLYRALFYSEQEGVIETFRPWSLPDPRWIESIRGRSV